MQSTVLENFLHVKTSIFMKDKYVLSRNQNATFNPSDEFSKLLIEKDEKYREPIITFINDEVGVRWAIRVQAFTEQKDEVKIYCDDEISFIKIKSIVLQKIREANIREFISSGSIENINW